MATYIIGFVLFLAGAFALKVAAKHFRGEGACCGGEAAAAPEKKKLAGRRIAEKTIHIKGMTCKNCKIRVEHLLNGIPDAAAEVNLNRNLAVLAMTRIVEDEEIYKALKDSGYEITSIELREIH